MKPGRSAKSGTSASSDKYPIVETSVKPARSAFMIPAALISDRTVPLAAKALYLTIRQIGPCTVNELCAAAGISRGSATNHLRCLVHAGWAALMGSRQRRHIVATRPLAVQEAMVRRLTQIRPCMLHVGEGLMKLGLDVVIDDDDYVDNARPWFLQNPTTFQFLEIDRLYGRLALGCEYGGIQHTQATERFPDETKVAETKARDATKAELCRKRGIVLVTFTEDDLSLEGLAAKLPPGIPRAFIDRDDLYIRCLDDMCSEYVANCRKLRARDQARIKLSGDLDRDD